MGNLSDNCPQKSWYQTAKKYKIYNPTYVVGNIQQNIWFQYKRIQRYQYCKSVLMRVNKNDLHLLFYNLLTKNLWFNMYVIFLIIFFSLQ